MTEKEIWNVGGITQSEFFLNIKNINDKVIHSDFVFEMYDSYPGTPWNGGRPTSKKPAYTFDVFVQGIEMLNRYGINFNLTFSNLLLEEKHLDDALGNQLLEKFHNGKNGIIVGSAILAKYIRKTFPKYRLIHTLTHYRMDKDYYRQALELYDILVLPPVFNLQFGFIQELGPERVEILVNETCHRHCPYSQEHYKKISEYNLAMGKAPYLEAELRHFCQRHHSQRLWPMSAGDLRKQLVGTHMIPAEVDQLKALGVNRFKLRGRTFVGGAHEDVFCDIGAFIFDRMAPDEIKDMTHFISTILSLNPQRFMALN